MGPTNRSLSSSTSRSARSSPRRPPAAQRPRIATRRRGSITVEWYAFHSLGWLFICAKTLCRMAEERWASPRLRSDSSIGRPGRRAPEVPGRSGPGVRWRAVRRRRALPCRSSAGRWWPCRRPRCGRCARWRGPAERYAVLQQFDDGVEDGPFDGLAARSAAPRLQLRVLHLHVVPPLAAPVRLPHPDSRRRGRCPARRPGRPGVSWLPGAAVLSCRRPWSSSVRPRAQSARPRPRPRRPAARRAACPAGTGRPPARRSGRRRPSRTGGDVHGVQERVVRRGDQRACPPGRASSATPSVASIDSPAACRWPAAGSVPRWPSMPPR